MTRRAYVDGRWGQVHLRRAGQGNAQRLLLLHQSPLSGAMFTPALSLLAAAGFDVVAPDTPGYGLSDPPPAPIPIETYGAAAGDVLDALDWDTGAVLGHHTGAAVAASFAVQVPARVERLILNGVPLLNEEDRAHFAQFRFDPIVPVEDGAHLLAAWRQRLDATPGWIDLGAMHRHSVEMLANPLRYGWGFEAAFAYDMAKDLMALTVPTAILTNSGEDLYDASCRARSLRPDFAFDALEGGTHDIVDEQPEAWAAAVVRLLQP